MRYKPAPSASVPLRGSASLQQLFVVNSFVTQSVSSGK